MKSDIRRGAFGSGASRSGSQCLYQRFSCCCCCCHGYSSRPCMFCSPPSLPPSLSRFRSLSSLPLSLSLSLSLSLLTGISINLGKCGSVCRGIWLCVYPPPDVQTVHTVWAVGSFLRGILIASRQQHPGSVCAPAAAAAAALQRVRPSSSRAGVTAPPQKKKLKWTEASGHQTQRMS